MGGSYGLEQAELRPIDAELFDRLMTVTESWTGAGAQGVGKESLDILSGLTKAVREAAATIEASSRSIARNFQRVAIPVNALSRPGMRLRRTPIWVFTEEAEDGTFVAELNEVGAVGYGETATEAAAAAAEALCEIYEELSQTRPADLGTQPAKWLVCLQELVERVDA
jgi:hypothetical protein